MATALDLLEGYAQQQLGLRSIDEFQRSLCNQESPVSLQDYGDLKTEAFHEVPHPFSPERVEWKRTILTQ
eukprot:11793064-Prorocentrum_lima.AAC.1